MDSTLRENLIKIAKNKIAMEDVSHDFEHAYRVLLNVEVIAQQEGGDLDILVPAALFHDLVVYQKNHPEKHKSQGESAKFAEKILSEMGFEQEKIERIKICILECSFSKGVLPTLSESKILQDADGLEATGAISIMRTFSSAGQMKRSFYHPLDPFCENREADASSYPLDLFYERLLKIPDRLHTKTAREMAKQRNKFLRLFLKELRSELFLSDKIFDIK
ncbi:MAG: HD domain-containing protein [Candidatus Micrarchaeota archaeon]